MLTAGYFQRDVDETGLSGTGRVAEYVEYSDGTVVVRWISNLASTNVYPNMKAATALHGHKGNTYSVVLYHEEDAPEPEAVPKETVAADKPSTEDVEIG